MRVAKKYVHTDDLAILVVGKAGGFPEAARHARQGDDRGHHDSRRSRRRTDRAWARGRSVATVTRPSSRRACCCSAASRHRDAGLLDPPMGGRQARRRPRPAAAPTYASDDDPELVGDALPFALKTIEGLSRATPRHKGLPPRRGLRLHRSTPTSTSRRKPTTSRRPIWRARRTCASGPWASTGARSSTGCAASRSTTRSSPGARRRRAAPRSSGMKKGRRPPAVLDQRRVEPRDLAATRPTPRMAVEPPAGREPDAPGARARPELR